MSLSFKRFFGNVVTYALSFGFVIGQRIIEIPLFSQIDGDFIKLTLFHVYIATFGLFNFGFLGVAERSEALVRDRFKEFCSPVFLMVSICGVIVTFILISCGLPIEISVAFNYVCFKIVIGTVFIEYYSKGLVGRKNIALLGFDLCCFLSFYLSYWYFGDFEAASFWFFCLASAYTFLIVVFNVENFPAKSVLDQNLVKVCVESVFKLSLLGIPIQFLNLAITHFPRLFIAQEFGESLLVVYAGFMTLSNVAQRINDSILQSKMVIFESPSDYLKSVLHMVTFWFSWVAVFAWCLTVFFSSSFLLEFWLDMKIDVDVQAMNLLSLVPITGAVIQEVYFRQLATNDLPNNLLVLVIKFAFVCLGILALWFGVSSIGISFFVAHAVAALVVWWLYGPSTYFFIRR